MHVAVIAVKSSQSYTYSLVQRGTQYRPLGPVPHTTPEKFENKGLILKTHQRFPCAVRLRNVKTQQSVVILDLCSKKSQSGISYD